MIAGAHNGDSFIVKEYAESEAEGIFKEFFKKWKLLYQH